MIFFDLIFIEIPVLVYISKALLIIFGAAFIYWLMNFYGG